MTFQEYIDRHAANWPDMTSMERFHYDMGFSDGLARAQEIREDVQKERWGKKEEKTDPPDFTVNLGGVKFKVVP